MKGKGLPLPAARVAACLIACAGCATPATVIVSPGYDASRVNRVALVRVQDFPGMAGSGDAAASIFEKYLILGRYRLVERRQVGEVMGEQALGAAGGIDPATARRLGKVLGVDALVFGSLSDYTDSRDRTVIVDVPQEHIEPVYGEVETTVRQGNVTQRTTQPVITGYTFHQHDEFVPEVETVPAHVGLSVRLVDAQSGEVLWSASASSDGDDLTAATEDASSRIMSAVAEKISPKR